MATRREKEKRKRRYSDAKTVMHEHDEGFSPTSFKVPEGVSVFRFSEEKVYKIDIIPYTVGEGNPRVDEGYDHYERTYWVHRGIGPNQESYTCLAKTFGKKCPVCEHRQRLSKDPESDAQLVKDLKPKERQLWLVYDYDDPDKGVQVMETAHYKSFGELLYSKVKASDEEDKYENFFHLEDGMTLKVSVEEDTFNGRTYFKPTNIEMRPRRKPLPSSITDDVPCLDELPLELSYKELKEKLMAEPPEDDEDEDKVEEDSELEEEEDEDDKPKKSKATSTSSEKKKLKKSGSPSKTSGAKKKTTEEEDEEEEELEVDEDEDVVEEDSELDVEDEEDEEEEEIDFEKGQRVKGTYKKKPFKGSVKKVINGLVHVQTDDNDLRVCRPEELTKLVKAKPKVEEEEDEDEGEEDESPKKSSKSSKTSSKKASVKEEEEDEEEDIPFNDEDEEEEEEEDDD